MVPQTVLSGPRDALEAPGGVSIPPRPSLRVRPSPGTLGKDELGKSRTSPASIRLNFFNKGRGALKGFRGRKVGRGKAAKEEPVE